MDITDYRCITDFVKTPVQLPFSLGTVANSIASVSQSTLPTSAISSIPDLHHSRDILPLYKRGVP
jgi:hypothetical protein